MKRIMRCTLTEQILFKHVFCLTPGMFVSIPESLWVHSAALSPESGLFITVSSYIGRLPLIVYLR